MLRPSPLLIWMERWSKKNFCMGFAFTFIPIWELLFTWLMECFALKAHTSSLPGRKLLIEVSLSCNNWNYNWHLLNIALMGGSQFSPPCVFFKWSLDQIWNSRNFLFCKSLFFFLLAVWYDVHPKKYWSNWRYSTPLLKLDRCYVAVAVLTSC